MGWDHQDSQNTQKREPWGEIWNAGWIIETVKEI